MTTMMQRSYASMSNSSHQLLAKARKNQAEKRRNQASRQAIQRPTRTRSNEEDLVRLHPVRRPSRSQQHPADRTECASISAPTPRRRSDADSTTSTVSSTSSRSTTAEERHQQSKRRPSHQSSHCQNNGSSCYNPHWSNSGSTGITDHRPGATTSRPQAPPQLPRRQASLRSMATMSCVSDLTEGRSLDDSMPIWGDVIDDKTAADPATTIGQRWSSGAAPFVAANNTTRQETASAPPPPAVPQHAASPSTSPKQVEILPGVWQPLRGTQETMQALDCNFVVHTTCVACTMKLTCIANAEYVLCPVCITVSPILGNKGNGGGVGYGVLNDS